jgi:hypothetical protein
MIEPERDLLARLHAIDEHLARVEPGPHIEARILSRLASPGPGASLAALVRVVFRLRRPLILGLATASAVALSLPAGTPEARSGLGAVHGIATPAGSPAVEGPREGLEPIVPDRPRTPLDPPEPSNPDRPEERRGPRQRPSAPPLPGPVPLSPHGLFEEAPAPRLFEPPRPARGDSSSSVELLEWTQAAPGASRVPFVAPEAPNPPPVEPKASSPAARNPPPPEPVAEACATAEALKEEAYGDCEGRDLVLSEITYLEPCDEGGFRRAEHLCDKPESDPEPNPDTCTAGIVGDGVTCRDQASLKEEAVIVCKSTGNMLADLVYMEDDCGLQSRAAKFTCCPVTSPEPEPPPDPETPVCKHGTLGDGVVCREMSLFKQEASQLCSDAGFLLTALYFGGECPDGQATKADVSCCAAP